MQAKTLEQIRIKTYFYSHKFSTRRDLVVEEMEDIADDLDQVKIQEKVIRKMITIDNRMKRKTLVLENLPNIKRWY